MSPPPGRYEQLRRWQGRGSLGASPTPSPPTHLQQRYTVPELPGAAALAHLATSMREPRPEIPAPRPAAAPAQRQKRGSGRWRLKGTGAGAAGAGRAPLSCCALPRALAPPLPRPAQPPGCDTPFPPVTEASSPGALALSSLPHYASFGFPCPSVSSSYWHL